jgi:predicted Ser/Thr protein kinase
VEPQQIAHYRITAKLGAGGMGEVYRATDTKLDREVALKILPDAFASDPDRMARFEREAKVLAALNHPNIAQIYGVEDRALVMELVEGHTLQGPLPLETALNYARQIAEAFEAAHEKGITHRDLKPANVKVTPEGVIKVLDFGLARTADDSAAATDASNSPTLTMSPTRAGMILGTAAYMSPEQAHGKVADRRSDIWAFGVVLYEMLAGKQAFTGESVADMLASVLKIEPDWEALPPSTPAAIRRLLRQCLKKDRRQRLQAIGDARIVLEEVIGGQSEASIAPAPFAPKARRRGILGWAAAGLMAIIAAVATWGWMHPTTPAPPGVVRLTIALRLADVPGAMALSRDGSRLAFIGGPQQQIYIRRMDQFGSHPIPGTADSSFLCFSPDGQWISYISGRPPKMQLKKIAIAGGPSQLFADALAVKGPPTQTWAADGYIYYSNNGALMRVASSGSQPETIASPNISDGEVFWGNAQLLPGRTILATVNLGRGKANQAVALSLQTHERKTLLDNIGFAQFLGTGPSQASGHLVYYDPTSETLMAVPFDAEHLEVKGSATPVLDQIQHYSTSPFGSFAASANGTLVYVPTSADQPSASSLVWVDRKGDEQPVQAPPRAYGLLNLSPDGQRVAVTISGESYDIWVYDLMRGTLQRITSQGRSATPVWTPDGKELIFEHRPPGPDAGVMSVPADGSAAPSILASHGSRPIVASSVSPEGKAVIGWYPLEGTLWILPLSAGSSVPAKPRSIYDSRFAKIGPQFSPDGHWVAYQSDDTGRGEIYVAAYPEAGGKTQISTDGGSMPRWARSGRELFYRNGNKMMAVDVRTGPVFQAGVPRMLFEGHYGEYYDVWPDGKRFLMAKPQVASDAATQVNIVLNWFEELRRSVPLGDTH